MHYLKTIKYSTTSLKKMNKTNNDEWPRGQQVQQVQAPYYRRSSISNPSTKGNTIDAAGGGPGGPVTIDDTSGGLGDPKFWIKTMRRRGGCNVCKEARELCKGCKNCNYENCGNCDNEEIHDLKEYKSHEECICNSKGLELLLEKKNAKMELEKLVHSLYLRREQKSPGKRYSPGERRRYGCFQPDFICILFKEFMNPIPDIPSNYISDWPWKWFLNEEKELERERWKEGLIRCPCGCSGWTHWEEEEEEEFMHWH